MGSVEPEQVPILYVPFDGVEREVAVRAGALWLMQQRGAPLVLVHQKGAYRDDELLARLTRRALVATPRTLFSSGWSSGPVLAPWPTEEVFGVLSGGLRSRATGICVLMWGDFGYQSAWLQANQARHLANGEVFEDPNDAVLPPVVEVAMRFLAGHVNHANGLASAYDRDVAIVALQRLHAAGHRFDADRLYAWSLANGFTHAEVRRLKDIAEKVQRGHRFRLHHPDALRRDVVAIWEAEARGTQA